MSANRNILRGWCSSPIDPGDRPGLATDERKRLKELEAENRELRRANAILKTVSTFYKTELIRKQGPDEDPGEVQGNAAASTSGAGAAAVLGAWAYPRPTSRWRPTAARSTYRTPVSRRTRR